MYSRGWMGWDLNRFCQFFGSGSRRTFRKSLDLCIDYDGFRWRVSHELTTDPFPLLALESLSSGIPSQLISDTVTTPSRHCDNSFQHFSTPCEIWPGLEDDHEMDTSLQLMPIWRHISSIPFRTYTNLMESTNILVAQHTLNHPTLLHFSAWSLWSMKKWGWEWKI